MMLAIKDAANDMSPYVRRTAAHSIPKLYHIDPEQLDQLLQVHAFVFQFLKRFNAGKLFVWNR